MLGLEVRGRHKAYPFSELEKLARARFVDRLGDVSVTIAWDRENATAEALDMNGEPLVATMSYWFAWYAFHPDTEVFRAATE